MSFRNLKKWMAGKIQINITYITDGVNSSVDPREIKNTIEVRRSNKSNLRFCSYEVKNPGEFNSRTYYYTEAFLNGKWGQVDNTWFADKNKALEAHLQTLDGADLTTKKVETVLWEGLSKEETESWVNLQKVTE